MWKGTTLAVFLVVLATATYINGETTDGSQTDANQVVQPCVSKLVSTWANTTIEQLNSCLNWTDLFNNRNLSFHVCIKVFNKTRATESSNQARNCGCMVAGTFLYNLTGFNTTGTCDNLTNSFNETVCPATSTVTPSVTELSTPPSTIISTVEDTTTTRTTQTTTTVSLVPTEAYNGQQAMENINNLSHQQMESNRDNKNLIIEVIKNISGKEIKSSEENPIYVSPKGRKTVVKSIKFGKEITNGRAVILDVTLDKNTSLFDLSSTVSENIPEGERESVQSIFGENFLSISLYKGDTSEEYEVKAVDYTISASNGNYDATRNALKNKTSDYTTGRIVVESLVLSCGFFNETTKRMSEEGCTTGTYVPNESVDCSCNHATVFAVLMSAKYVAVPDGVKVVSYIAEITSVIFLIITATLLMKVRNHVRGDRVKVQICVTFSLLALHVLNIFHDLALQNDTTCEIVAVLMHYSFLCSAMWMLMEGITLLFKTMDSVMRLLSGKNAKKFAIARYVISFSVPFIIVLVSAAYGFANEVYMPINVLYARDNQGLKYKHCYLSAEANILLGAAVIPIAIILFACLCIVIRMFYIVYKMSVESENYKPTNLHRNSSASEALDLEHVKAALKAILVLLPVLGIPWFLGFFTGIEVGEAGVTFMYLNAIINGFQGVFLFFVYCVIGKEVRKSIINARKKYSVSFEFTSKGRSNTSDITALSTSGHGTMSTNMTTGGDVFSESESKVENGKP